MSANSPDSARILVPPPLLYAVPLVGGLLLNHWRPSTVLPSPWPSILGPLVTSLGLVGLPAVLAFRRAGTNPRPWEPATALVVSGPYRVTRNPMYLGFTLLYLGITIWINSLWPLLFLPAIVLIMDRVIIPREEAYLDRRFGEAYRRYRERVRRWL